MGTVHVKRKKTSESLEQQAFFKWLEYYPSIRRICYAIPNGGYRNKKLIHTKQGKSIYVSLEAKRMKAEGVTSGVPDVCIARTSKCCTYHALYIEFKIRPNKMTLNQEVMKVNLEASGNKVVVCYGWEEAKKEVEIYFGWGGEKLSDKS